MPVEISVKTNKDGRQTVVGRIKPGHYATVDDYSSGRRKNLSIHVYPGGRSAGIFEFSDGGYTTMTRPGYRFLPLVHYSKHNLDKVIYPGQRFEHPLLTKKHMRGKLVFSFLPSHRGARTSLAGRHR